jgi:hypothetical protein
MRLRLMFVAYEVFVEAFMKISQLNLLPALFEALCETATNVNVRNDHYKGRVFIFPWTSVSDGLLFRVVCMYGYCGCCNIQCCVLGDLKFIIVLTSARCWSDVK